MVKRSPCGRRPSLVDPVCVECLIGKQKKPILFKVTEPSSVPIIDGFSALNIFEVSYVEQKLNEIKSAFKKDYNHNNQYVKFFKKVNKQVKTEVNDDVKGGAKGRKKK